MTQIHTTGSKNTYFHIIRYKQDLIYATQLQSNATGVTKTHSCSAGLVTLCGAMRAITHQNACVHDRCTGGCAQARLSGRWHWQDLEPHLKAGLGLS